MKISVLYFIIGCKLYRREPPGVQTSQGKAKLNQDKKKIIQMLFSVVLLFALSWLPYIINKLLNIFPPRKGFKSPDVFVFVGNFLGLVNSVANPIVYAALNKNFRIAFKHAIRCHCKYEREERRRQSIISLRNTTQTRDRKRSSTVTCRQGMVPNRYNNGRKNSVFSGSMEWAVLPEDEHQIRCLSFKQNDDLETIPQGSTRRSSVPNKHYSTQRRVSFGPEITSGEVALEDLQWESTHLKLNKKSRRNSNSGTRPRSLTASNLGAIRENSTLFDTKDIQVNQGFDLD
ncbi:hypothetical protein QZH41_007562 [Actinostola sp. cb2023]|nr:hypothetical protein QZH41_007562 [Actinostola sp. cb2023]